MKASRKRSILAWPKGWRKSLWVIPAIGLFIKFIIISQIPGNAWLGADGENYLKGLEFLIRDGFLSTESILHYWPAGYPLLMWVLGFLTPQLTLPIMAVLQSTVYALATAHFAQKINQTSLKRFALPIAVILTISPTLTLNTIAIGYELISASVFLLSMAILIDLHLNRPIRFLDKRILFMGLALSINNFVQPRFLLSSLIIFVCISIFFFSKRMLPIMVLTGMIISFLFPSILIVRNMNANDFSAISTNLGVTMRIGAGDGATGAYVPTFTGVNCPTVTGNAAEVDQALVRCTINWYLDNPQEIVRLSINKSIYFWSPWFGPLANGSMARNPWLQVHPFYGLATESQEGYNFVYGSFGKSVSWIWIVSYLGLMALGLLRLRREGQIGTQLAIVSSLLITSNWLISLGTLGDHRQRLPILTLIIFLQIVGFSELSQKFRKKKQKKYSNSRKAR